MKAEITAEKDEYIKEKKEQFRLVDMRKQYADIIAEAEQDCFFAELDAVKPEDVFMSMDELCTPKTPVHQKSTSSICEQNRDEAMEK